MIRVSSAAVAASAVTLYAIGFVALFPNAIVVSDESAYVAQAVAFANGRVTLKRFDPLRDEFASVLPSTYPPGTSLLQMPFVAAFGWRGAPLASLLALVLMVASTARWLRNEGRDPVFALVPLLYLPTLALGRVGMSDVPSGAVCAAGLLCFWAGTRGRPPCFVVAGFLAGASTLFRETNVLVFAPLFLGALLRRDRGALLLVPAGLAGVGLRLLASALLFDDPFFYRPNESLGPALDHIVAALPIQLLALTVLVPGGLLWLLDYRGPRRPELLATAALVVGFYTSYGYAGAESGFVKQLVLGPRFLLPLTPLIAFAMAESVPRRVAPLLEWPSLAKLHRPLAMAASLAVALVLVGVHFPLHRWGATQAGLAEAMFANMGERALFIGNSSGVAKFAGLAPGERTFLNREETSPERVARLAEKHEVHLVLLDRSDSTARITDSVRNAEFLEATRHWCRLEVTHDRRHSAIERLVVARVRGCRGSAAAP